ncbi:MAG: hypothetical protein ACSLFP_15530 [Acidimicrobiales bacterium]
MNAIAFLLIVVGVSALGGIVLWLQHRQPSNMESGVDAFKREMDALAPPPDGDRPPRKRVARPTRPPRSGPDQSG